MITEIAFPHDKTMTLEQNDIANGRPRATGRNGTYAIGAVELMTMNGGANVQFTPISQKRGTILDAGFNVPAVTARAMAEWILANVPAPQQAPTPVPASEPTSDYTPPNPNTDKLLGHNHEGNPVYLQPDGRRYYVTNNWAGATVSLHDADLTNATIFYIFQSWFTTEELESDASGIKFNGLKE